MSRNEDNAQVWIFLIAKFFVPIMIVFTVIVVSIINCADDTDPMDKGWTQFEIVCNLSVLDSIGEGFRVAYITTKGVTPERLKEIRSRESIQNAMERLQEEAPKHFGGSLLDVDIYDFAYFVREFDIDPILKIHCIFVEGKWKCEHYIGPNPNIPNSAKYMDLNTEQGVQWIDDNDVYYRNLPEKRIYRYWKCFGLYDTSCTDEHFSHFSEDERIR